MRLRVLGCSGSIGGQHNRTTSFLVDQDILIDAGTGVGDLSLPELTLIDHIFVTHSHLDHVNSIAFFLDSVGALRPKPVTVYAMAPTIETLKKHLFNWDIWPDFTQIPTPEQPWLRYHEIDVGTVITLGGRKITALPAIHTVPGLPPGRSCIWARSATWPRCRTGWCWWSPGPRRSWPRCCPGSPP